MSIGPLDVTEAVKYREGIITGAGLALAVIQKDLQQIARLQELLRAEVAKGGWAPDRTRREGDLATRAMVLLDLKDQIGVRLRKRVGKS